MSHSLPMTCLASGMSVGNESLAGRVSQSSRDKATAVSAVDRAISNLVVVTRMTGSVSADWEPQHGLILTASAVAIAEDFVRSILADVVTLCPLAAERSYELDTRMEFVFEGDPSEALRGVLDKQSFSSRTTVTEWLKRLLGKPVAKNSTLDTLLADFERVSHIRHCAVHAGGYISGHNAKNLGVPRGHWISFAEPGAVHEVIATVASTVRTVNQFVFESVVSSWIDQQVLCGVWSVDKLRFDPLYRALVSLEDSESSRFNPQSVRIRERSYDSYRSIQKAVVSRNA